MDDILSTPRHQATPGEWYVNGADRSYECYGYGFERPKNASEPPQQKPFFTHQFGEGYLVTRFCGFGSKYPAIERHEAGIFGEIQGLSLPQAISFVASVTAAAPHVAAGFPEIDRYSTAFIKQVLRAAVASYLDPDQPQTQESALTGNPVTMAAGLPRLVAANKSEIDGLWFEHGADAIVFNYRSTDPHWSAQPVDSIRDGDLVRVPNAMVTGVTLGEVIARMHAKNPALFAPDNERKFTGFLQTERAMTAARAANAACEPYAVARLLPGQAEEPWMNALRAGTLDPGARITSLKSTNGGADGNPQQGMKIGTLSRSA